MEHVELCFLPTAKELTPLEHKLGATIARARKNHGMTQEQLASLLNVSRQAISHWEMGDSQPNYEMLVKLVQVLELNTAELLLPRQ